MPKYYIIPVDANNRAYVGVKSVTNPYTGAPYGYCGGCPNLFGGNLQTTIDNTLYKETREESHFKIDLEQEFIDQRINHPIMPPPGLPQGIVQLLHIPAGVTDQMTFYAMRAHFQYNAAPFFPALLANQAKYRETTGEVVTIDLTQVNRLSRQGAAGDAMIALPLVSRQQITGQAQAQFLMSESAEAIRLAAMAVFTNQI